MKTVKQHKQAQLKGLALISKLTNKTKAEQSVRELVNQGITQTGCSGYSKGWKNKSIWTSQTVILAEQLGLVVESFNDAPRGGASGEQVRLVDDKRKNKIIHQLIESNQFLFKKKKSATLVLNLKIQFFSNIKRNKTVEFFNDEIKSKLMSFCLRKGISFPLSNKEANQIAWKKQNWIEGGADVCAFRDEIKHFSREYAQADSYSIFN